MKMQLAKAIKHAAAVLSTVASSEEDAAAFDALDTANCDNLRLVTPEEIKAMREVLDDACQLQRAEKFYGPTRSSQIVEEWLARQDAWREGAQDSQLHSNVWGLCVLSTVLGFGFIMFAFFGA